MSDKSKGIKETVTHIFRRNGHRDVVKELPAKPLPPRTLEQVTQEYNQVCLQLGHNQRQRDVHLPRVIGELNEKATALEKEAQVLSAAAEVERKKSLAELDEAVRRKNETAGNNQPTEAQPT